MIRSVRRGVLILVSVALLASVALVVVSIWYVCQRAYAGLMSRQEFDTIENQVAVDCDLELVEARSVGLEEAPRSLGWKIGRIVARGVWSSHSAYSDDRCFAYLHLYRHGSEDLGVLVFGVGDRVHRVELCLDGGESEIALAWKREFSRHRSLRTAIRERVGFPE